MALELLAEETDTASLGQVVEEPCKSQQAEQVVMLGVPEVNQSKRTDGRMDQT